MSSGLLICRTCGTSLDDLPLLSIDASNLPHRDILNSNDSPLPEDTQSIWGCIQENDFKVSQLDRLLDDMNKARAERSKLAKSYRDLFSPLRRFPAELLAEIFLFCVRPCVKTTLLPDKPPWVFGKVCRRWRSVALSTPQLWSEFSNISLSSNEKPYLQLLSTSLRLSRPFPLYLDLTTDSQAGTPTYPALDIISSHAHRCESLVISTNSESLPILECAFGGISSLHSLTIRLLGSFEGFADYHSLSAFQLSPNIQALEIESPPCYSGHTDGPFIQSWLKISWNNLTSFSGRRLRTQYITDLLHSAPSLIRCSFTELTRPGKGRFTNVTHTELRYLRLHFGTRSGFSASLLDCLTLPSLAELRMTPGAGIRVGSLTSFFLRSSSSLSTLTLEGSGYKGMGPLMASLAKAPLTNLNIEFYVTDDFDLEALIGQPSEGELPCLPHLQHLTAHHPSFQSSFIARLIRSRTTMAKTLGTKALDTVTLVVDRSVDGAWDMFNELEGWSEQIPQHGQVKYSEFIGWLRMFQCITKWSTPLGRENEVFLHETILIIEVCGTDNIPPIFLHRSMICDHLPLVTRLSDNDFREGDQYQLRQRASVILESWRVILKKYVSSPGWSLRRGPGNGSYYNESTLAYSTAGRDYLR